MLLFERIYKNLFLRLALRTLLQILHEDICITENFYSLYFSSKYS